MARNRAIFGTMPRVTIRSDHGSRGQADGGDLGRGQALLEDEDAQGDVDQRAQEVAEAGVEDLAAGDREDVGEPVGGDQQGGGREAPAQAGVEEGGGDGRQAPRSWMIRRQDEGGPEDPVGHDLERRHVAQGLEVERVEAPEREGAGPHEQAGAGIRSRAQAPGGARPRPGPRAGWR